MNKIEKMLKEKGYDLSKLKEDKTKYIVTNLDKAAVIIKEAVRNYRHIFVVADYDCDGVMSGSILYLILRHIGANFTVRFPKKMSEGYGISEKIVNEIPDESLVITIDNGIAAIEAIDLANSRGMDVVILDHHQIRGDGMIPKAACIVDPHIYKEDDEFEHYCGAGIGYKLAVQMELPDELINQSMLLAAIATVQDVVPLIDDNRNIVKRGLEILNKESVHMPGLYSLCDALKLERNAKSHGVDEEDIAFQIGPCINAMGRMLDDGANLAFEYLMQYDLYKEDGIREMVEWNKKRKEETTKQQNILEVISESIKTPKTTCMVLYAPDLHEGIIGINAAKVVEKYNMPAIILTDSENGMLKGSARSTDDINMKDMLDQVSEFVYKYGGHAGAAGLTVEKEKLKDFTKAINAVIPKTKTSNNSWNYDLEILEDEVPEIYQAIREYAPYGEAFPAPTVRINGYKLVKKYGKYYREVGQSGISLNGEKIESVSFTLKEKFQSYNCPLELNLVGNLGYSRYSKQAQVLLKDFQPIIKQQEISYLI